MRAIQTTAWGSPPVYIASAADPPEPTPSQSRLKVLASALHRLVRSQALGQHYSSTSSPLPYTPGADGIGLDESTGTRYYFSSIATGGGFAEHINVEKSQLVELGEGADALQAAALVNPGMASWMGLRRRTSGVVGMKEGWTVAILGVTSQSGKVAVQFARTLGASRVIGVARDAAKMATLGIDEIIVLDSAAPEKSEWSKMGDVDIILDFLYGNVAPACLTALKSSVPTQYVQIGALSGNDASFDASVFRSKDITIRGSGPGAWSMKEFGEEVRGLVKAVEGLAAQDGVVSRGLDEVEGAWADERGRTVFVP